MAARVLSRSRKFSLVRATAIIPLPRSPAEIPRPNRPAPVPQLPAWDRSSSSADTSSTTAGIVPEKTQDRRSIPLHQAGLRGDLGSTSPAELLRPVRPAPLHRLPGAVHQRRFTSWTGLPPNYDDYQHQAGYQGQRGHHDTQPGYRQPQHQQPGYYQLQPGYNDPQAGYPPQYQGQPGYPPQYQGQPGYPLQYQGQPGYPLQYQGQLGYPDPQAGLPKVPILPTRPSILYQTSCFTSTDYDQAEWLTPRSYMERYPAVMGINMDRRDCSSHVRNCLIPKSDPPALVLSPSTKVLWQSLIDLVVLNRQRGYCISKSIKAENLMVSNLDGRFALIEALATDLHEPDSEFFGFEAARDLFKDLLVKQYGEGVIALLTHDVSHLLAALGDPSKVVLSGQHPALMSYQKCAELMVRLHQLLTMELRYCYRNGHRGAAQRVFEGLFNMYPNLNDMHPFFKSWWQHTEKISKATNEHSAQWITDPDLEQARWLVRMHRHAVMHSHSYELCQIARSYLYTKKDVVGLLQYKCPEYLPEAVSLCVQQVVWKFLHLNIDARNPK